MFVFHILFGIDLVFVVHHSIYESRDNIDSLLLYYCVYVYIVLHSCVTTLHSLVHSLGYTQRDAQQVDKQSQESYYQSTRLPEFDRILGHMLNIRDYPIATDGNQEPSVGNLRILLLKNLCVIFDFFLTNFLKNERDGQCNG